MSGVEGFAFTGGAPDLLGQRQRGAAISIGHPYQHGACFFIERQFFVLDPFGMGEQLFDRRRVQRMEHQHPSAGQQRGVEFERGIFGGGADQHHRAVFHDR